MARIDDGHSTTIAFSASSSAPLLLLYEKEVTPVGVAGGGENDTTTMLNAVWRTKAPKSLITLTPLTLVAAYDPAVLTEIVSTVNTNQSIVLTFPDGSTWTFWGWIDEFTPNNIVEGEQPTVNLTVIPSNQNDSGVETSPVYAEAA